MPAPAASAVAAFGRATVVAVLVVTTCLLVWHSDAASAARVIHSKARFQKQQHPLIADPYNQPANPLFYGPIQPHRPTRAQSPEKHDRVLTSYRCTIHVHTNVSCIFHNLYMQHHSFFAALLKGDNYTLNEYYVELVGFPGSGRFVPYPLWFDTVEQAEIYMANVDVKPDLTLFLSQPFHGNFAHGMFDGLYPNFLSMIEFGMQDEDFDILAGVGPCDNPFNECESMNLFRRISGGEISRVDDYRLIYNDTTFASGTLFLMFSHVVIGANDKAERNFQRDVALAGRNINGLGINGLKIFVRRTLSRFGVTLPPRPDNDLFRVILVQNKRYNETEMNMMRALAEKYRMINSKIHIEYIDWYYVRPTSTQFKMLAHADCYVTAPGTGMFLHLFMNDGTFVINVGDCASHVGPPHRRLAGHHRYPLFGDQFMTEAADWQKGLYYDSRSRCQGLDPVKFESLILQAYSMRGFKIPVPAGTNLSPEARVWLEVCKRNATSCDIMRPIIRDADTFIETYVYELGQWHPEAAALGLQTYAIDRPLLRQVKQEFASEIVDSPPPVEPA